MAAEEMQPQLRKLVDLVKSSKVKRWRGGGRREDGRKGGG